MCNSDMYYYYLNTGILIQPTVTIVSTPAGTPVSGSTNTFDYPILSSVNLTCMVDPPPSGTVIYSWNTTGCYVNNNGERRCFPVGQTTYNVSNEYLLARDAGTITCTVTTDGVDYTSALFTLRISGIFCLQICMYLIHNSQAVKRGSAF